MSDQSRSQPTPRPGGLTGAQKWLLAAVALPFAGLFLPSLVVFAIGMLPTLGAFVADRYRQRHLTVTVALMNFCGTVPAAIDLWMAGQDYDALDRVVRDPVNWLIAYVAAACGWCIYLGMTPIVAAYFKVVTDGRVLALRRTQRQLVETWGEEVAEQAGDVGEDVE